MAAQKLTRGRLVQIIIMLSILLAAFTWRTITYKENDTLDCILGEPCEYSIDDHYVRLTKDILGVMIIASESGDFTVGSQKNGKLVKKNAHTWLLTPQTQEFQIEITFPQQKTPVTIHFTKANEKNH
ncbi:hypothetical protein L4C37_10490 [Vibrio kagoshimensis]|uniref:hypothetical protein n=1 Tax=Vibrio kagoshimensis TaxID=2910244 RepID=UPI003D226BBA